MKRFNVKRTIKLLWDSGSQWTIANGVLLVIQGLIPVVSLYLMKLIIDQVTASLDSGGETADFGPIFWLIGLAVAVAILGVLLKLISKIVNDALAQLMSDHVYEILHEKSVQIDLEYYDNAQYYDVMHQAQSQAVYRPHKIMLELIAIAQCSISLIAILGLLISLHWSISFILFFLALPGVLVRLKFARKQHRWMRRNTPTQRLS
ncbi:MAG: ABC transporter ATP-binding protein, partial [Leptolyngbya sp. SIO4C1]|nr:ABC transporter ATP-binding protein [Leptolyngbya sp. SIO4C1]